MYGASVEVDSVDTRKVCPHLRFEEGKGPSPVTPLVGLGLGHIAPAAVDQRIERLKLSATRF